MNGRAAGRGRPGGREDRRHLVGTVVAIVPVLLFGLSVVFVALREPDTGRCRHDHGVEQVREWWREARREGASVRGTRYIAFDDSLRCIHVGLEEATARAHLQRRFRRLEIPREVVVYEMVEGEGDRP